MLYVENYWFSLYYFVSGTRYSVLLDIGQQDSFHNLVSLNSSDLFVITLKQYSFVGKKLLSFMGSFFYFLGNYYTLPPHMIDVP